MITSLNFLAPSPLAGEGVRLSLTDEGAHRPARLVPSSSVGGGVPLCAPSSERWLPAFSREREKETGAVEVQSDCPGARRAAWQAAALSSAPGE